MPTVQQSVKMNSQQLGKTSTEELSNLAKMSQRPVAPTAPIDAATIGANPDQAKMAGSSANKLSALRTAVQQSSELGSAQRRQGPASASGADAQNIARIQKLQGALGDLRSRVPQLMLDKARKQAVDKLSAKPAYSPQQFKMLGIEGDANIQKAQGAIESIQSIQKEVDAAKAALTPEAVAYLGGGEIKRRQDALDALLNKQGAASAEIRKLAGRDIAPEEFAEMEKDRQSQMQADAINSIKDANLTIGALTDEDLKPLGMTAAQLKAMAPKGVDPSAMSWDEFSDSMLAEANKDFNSAAAIKQKLSAPGLGPAERAALQQRLGALGDAGVASQEQKANDIAAQMRDGDNIMVNGKAVQIDSLFQDAGATADMAGWASAETPEQKSQIENDIKQKYGQNFLDYMNKNRDAIAEQSKNMSAAAVQLGKIQSANKDLDKLPDSPDRMSADLMKKLIPGWGDFSSAPQQLPKEALTHYLMEGNLDAGHRQIVLQNIEELQNTPMFADIRKMSSDDISSLGLDKPGFAAEVKSLATAKDFAKSASTPEDLISIIFGADALAQIQTLQKTPGGLRSMPGDIQNLLDSNGDGKFDDINAIKRRILAPQADNQTALTAVQSKLFSRFSQMLTMAEHKASDFDTRAAAAKAEEESNRKKSEAVAATRVENERKMKAESEAKAASAAAVEAERKRKAAIKPKAESGFGEGRADANAKQGKEAAEARSIGMGVGFGFGGGGKGGGNGGGNGSGAGSGGGNGGGAVGKGEGGKGRS